MPKLLFVADGPTDTAVRGSDDVTFAELAGAFAKYSVKYLWAEPRSINESEPALHANRVLVQVSASDGTNKTYPKPGFYLLGDFEDGLTPTKAADLLLTLRDKAR